MHTRRKKGKVLSPFFFFSPNSKGARPREQTVLKPHALWPTPTLFCVLFLVSEMKSLDAKMPHAYRHDMPYTSIHTLWIPVGIPGRDKDRKHVGNIVE